MPFKDPDKQRKWQRDRLARRRAEFFADKACTKCGSTDRLELDHIDPDQKVSHKIYGWTAERFAAEVAKCQVLCHPCHRKKTNSDMGWGTGEHGLSLYRHGKCRCDVCREASVEAVRRWRVRTGRR